MKGNKISTTDSKYSAISYCISRAHIPKRSHKVTAILRDNSNIRYPYSYNNKYTLRFGWLKLFDLSSL